MKQRSILRYLLPMVVMIVFAGLLLAEMTGISIEARGASISLLDDPVPAAAQAGPARILVACNPADSVELQFCAALTSVLDETRYAYQKIDLSSSPLPDLAAFDTFLYCSQSLVPLQGSLNTIFAWVENGGRFALMMTPVIDDVFRVISRKLGIVEYDHDYQQYGSIRYVSGLLPLWGDAEYSENGGLNDYALIVQLDDACTVHIVSGGEITIPLLWERPSSLGRIAVLNTTLMVNRGGRGYALAVMAALNDTLVYPIINAGMVFIDDFPAPQPEGFNDQLKQQFGYSIQGFFRNHWWPDMKQLAWDYGIRFTGVLIETYNTNVCGPFTAKGVDDSLLKYYTAELLHSGGEMGLHGYNHMPLCMADFDYSGVDYTPWPSTNAMSHSLLELYRYGKTLYIGADFQTYVPPSNLMSDVGRKTLLGILPNIKVISGLYLGEEGVNALVQEFDEADGAVNVPRITSGFETDEFMDFVAAQELMLHGVYSHFIHPDDILDSERSQNLSWSEMFGLFQGRIEKIAEAYPELRYLTASEGAGAVQRFSRVGVLREEDERGLTVTLSNFYDEVWLALRTRVAPESVTGGELYKITDGFYWLRADEAVVRVLWEAGT